MAKILKTSKSFAGKTAQKLRFEKLAGLVPAVAQDCETGEVLMLAFMNEEALVKTLTSGRMHYYSRTRGRVWRKGEESGNEQLVVRVFTDCDCDSLLFKVRQVGSGACHTGSRTCFGQGDFPLERLFQIIEERKRNPKKGSYTCKLLKDKRLALEKVCEESREVLQAETRGQGRKALVWESADLLYHLFVLLACEGIALSEIQQELKKRHEKKNKKR